MSSKDEFEAWFINRTGFSGRGMEVNWDNPDVKLLLETWVASRAALVVELPKVIIDDDMNKAEWEAARDMLERCQQALIDAGIQVKP